MNQSKMNMPKFSKYFGETYSGYSVDNKLVWCHCQRKIGFLRRNYQNHVDDNELGM